MKKKKVIFAAGVGGHLTELLQLDYSKELYDIKAEKWLKYIRSVVLGEEN